MADHAPDRCLAFISHASEDAAVAYQLAHDAEAAGLRCFIASRDIPPGSDWAATLVHAIARCPAFVILCSRATLRSEHVLREISQAVHHRRRLVPIRLDRHRLPPSFDYFLGTSQWVDASRRGLPAVIGAILEALRTIAGTSQSFAPALVDPAPPGDEPPAKQIALDEIFRSPRSGVLSRWINRLLEDR